MKKLFPFIMIFSLLLAISGTAVSANDSDAISLKLGQQVGLSGSADIASLNPADWFKHKGPKGMYLLMYNEVKTKPQSVALKRVLDASNLSDKDKLALAEGTDISLFNVLTGPGQGPFAIGDYFYTLGGSFIGSDAPSSTEYVAKNPDAQQVSQMKLRAQMDELKENFQIEAQVADLQSELEGEVTATEIFADGNTDNSGFDLLKDLDTIHMILFGEPTTLLSSQGAGNQPGSAQVKVGGNGNKKAPAGKPKAAPKNESKKTGVARNGIAAAEGGGNSQDQNGFSAAQCTADQGLENALQDYENQATGNDGGFAGSSGDGGAGNGKTASSQNRLSQNANATSGKTKTPIQPAQAKDWLRELPCNDTFCLTVEAVKKTESARPANVSCIACHIEKMNDIFNKTLKHNLIPSKATGNLLELPTCKKGWDVSDLLHFNVLILPNPILTPPNDDLITRNAFLSGYDDFCKKYSPIFDKAICPSGDPNNESRLETIEQETKRALAASTEASTFSSIDTEVGVFLAQKQHEAFQRLEQLHTVSRALNYSRSSNAILGEIDTLKAYFESFQKLFQYLNQPCSTLRNLPVCS